MKLFKYLAGLFWDSITEMNWTLSGTILVLITLSGDTQEVGIKIFAASTLINIAQIMSIKHKESKQESSA
jgi:hypothetical protein